MRHRFLAGLAVAAMTEAAWAQCVQLAPNPNPLGETINVFVDTCNQAQFDNSGLVEIHQNLLNTGTINNSGVVQTTSLGSITNDGTIHNNNVLNQNAALLTNNGTLNNQAALIASDGSTVNNGVLNNLIGGFVGPFAGSPANSHLLINSADGVVNNAGEWQWAHVINRGTFNNMGAPSGPFLGMARSGLFANSGTLNNGQRSEYRLTFEAGTPGHINSGTINNSGSLVISGPMQNQSGATILNNASGQIVVDFHPFRNDGLITNSGEVSLSATQGPPGLTRIEGSGTFNQLAGVTTVDLSMTQGAVNIHGGVLRGSGTITAPVVVDGGSIAPGNSPGQLNIVGSYTQGALGTFEAEIGGLVSGSEYDVLNVTGTATLDGTLLLSLYDLGSGTFVPSVGDSFDIIRAEDIMGSFSTLSFAALATGLEWQVSYLHDFFGTTDVVRLSVHSVAAPIPEPETYAMLLAGLVLLGFEARRRRRVAF